MKHLLEGIVAALLCAAPAAAQMNVHIVPKIGVFTPMSGLTGNTELSSGLALGVAAEFGIPLLPLRLRANVEHLTGTELERRNEEETRVGDVVITTLTGAAVLRPLPATALFQPYFLAGAGVKRYEMELENLAGGELSGVAQSQSRFTGQAGGGVDVRVGPLAMVLEVSDYISTFVAGSGESRLQNDLFGMLGFRISF